MRVRDIEHGQIESDTGRAFFRDGDLARDSFDGGNGVVFHNSDADLGFKDDDEQAVFIHVNDEHAEFFALLINAVEIIFVDESGDGLVGHECAGRKRADGREVKIVGVALMRDEKPAFINDQRRRRIRAFDKFAERAVQMADVVLNKLGQSGHVMRIAACFD